MWSLVTEYHISKYWHLAKWKRQDKEKRHFVMLTFLSRCQSDLRRGQSLRKIMVWMLSFLSVQSGQKQYVWSRLTDNWDRLNVFLLQYADFTSPSTGSLPFFFVLDKLCIFLSLLGHCIDKLSKDKKHFSRAYVVGVSIFVLEMSCYWNIFDIQILLYISVIHDKDMSAPFKLHMQSL